MSANHRCEWAESDPLMRAYHDREWGVPLYDDGKLFEFLVLEGAQAGLSWLTVLKKRENYRKAFHGFDAEKIARYGRRDVSRLLQNTGIIRNRLKIEAAITNARAFLKIQKEERSFSSFIWRFVDGKPIQNKRRSLKDLPARTSESDALSHALKEKGFRFVGSTICYAHMQATGMVNDHLVSCFRHREVQHP
ncbi:MAG: DNA-3-methyladenine glycosylase I [Candidatus Omnitrophica bacterium]|nr:DNA-3-methyladenine glycosylase I [Candidatus Omnitrophota bacterium]